jgi:YCII-related domain
MRRLVLRTDGPFAETKEVVGGFEVLDCASLDEAIDLVSRHTVAEYGCIELWTDSCSGPGQRPSGAAGGRNTACGH